MQICKLTQSKLDYLEIMCNFTEDELKLFQLRAKGKSLEDCAEMLNVSVSTVKRISQSVNEKVEAEL